MNKLFRTVTIYSRSAGAGATCNTTNSLPVGKYTRPLNPGVISEPGLSGSKKCDAAIIRPVAASRHVTCPLWLPVKERGGAYSRKSPDYADECNRTQEVLDRSVVSARRIHDRFGFYAGRAKNQVTSSEPLSFPSFFPRPLTIITLSPVGRRTGGKS